jgi:uncharacterized OB-fold protein
MAPGLRNSAPPALSAIVNQTLDDEWAAPFWHAATEHRLVGPRCTTCGSFRLPPARHCWSCRAQAVEWIELPGTGTVFTFTVIRHPLRPDLAEYVPYVPALVELDEAPGYRLITNVVECDPADIRAGMRVQVVWDTYTPPDGGGAPVTVPRFMPSS